MYELLVELTPYAPFVVLVATFLDSFFLSGYFLYGAAMMGSVLMMHASGIISIPMLIITAFTGTIAASTVNFWVGRFCSEAPFVAQRLHGPRVNQARTFLRTRGLFVFMTVGRFVTFTRPIYALIIGTLEIRFRRFIIYECAIAFFWVCFWMFVILQGELLARWLYSLLGT